MCFCWTLIPASEIPALTFDIGIIMISPVIFPYSVGMLTGSKVDPLNSSVFTCSPLTETSTVPYPRSIMSQRCLDEPEGSPRRLVGGIPVFVDEVLGQNNRAIKTAFVNLKLQLLTNIKPGKTTHTVGFTYRTLVLGREALVSQLPFGEKLSQPYEVHAVPPFLILDG